MNSQQSKAPKNITQRKLDLALLGDRIAYVRYKRGLTQSQLGELTGMNPEEISRIETGVRFPGSFKVIALADALEISTDFILRGIGDPFPNSDTSH